MTRIVVAIDFSECSMNAFLHALSMAKKCQSDITLIWVKKGEKEKDKYEASNGPVTEVRKNFEELIEKYQPELPGNTITYKIRTGKVYKEVSDEARDEKAMLTVVGTHGASVFTEFWIGSNANRIISLSSNPVITIRSGIDINRPLANIIMPIDNTLETRQKTPFTAYLAKKHDAKIHILSVYTSKVKDLRRNVDLYARQVAVFLEKENIPFEITGRDSDNLADTTIEYAKEIDANLISIMKQQESTTSTLWMGPVTQRMVNNSPVPVMVFHSRNTLASGVGF
ncbi:MAG: universal stress protein [Bacteroidota bacterium]|nr:universal stress protein [Bacteroidota bacterium]